MKDAETPSRGPTRRGFLKGGGLAAVAGGLMGQPGLAQDAAPAATTRVLAKDDLHALAFTLNGKPTKLKVKTGHTLLEVLRDELDLTGTKLVCDMGSCGACTVHVDGVSMNSCLTLALDVQGKKVDTIEGLAKGGKLHPLQQAFVEEDGLQCGFCTPGMIMSCKALLDRNPSPTRDETKEALSGNICRCGTYDGIFRAVDKAAKRMRGGK